MSATNTFENEVADFVFNATAIASLSGVTQFYISLHTADPGEAGSQSTNETAYTGYARVAVARSSSGLTVSGNAATNTAQLSYGKCTASPGGNITHVGLGDSSSGTGTLRASLELTSPIVMAIGATPIFEIGELEFTVE